MTCGRDNEWCVDCVWIHTGLIVVVHRDESPVCDNAGNAECAIGVGTSNEIFDSSGIEKLDIGEGEDFGKKGGGEERLFIVQGKQGNMEDQGGHTACLTTTKSPSSSNGTPRSVKKASAGLRMTMALKSWPPSQAPPPGETEASMMAILRSGRDLQSM